MATMYPDDPQFDRIEQAVEALVAKDLITARRLLVEELHHNPHSENAWMIMSSVVSDDAQKKDCLRRVLQLNPNNQQARQALASLEQPTQPEETPAAVEEEAALPVSPVAEDEPVADAVPAPDENVVAEPDFSAEPVDLFESAAQPWQPEFPANSVEEDHSVWTDQADEAEPAVQEEQTSPEGSVESQEPVSAEEVLASTAGTGKLVEPVPDVFETPEEAQSPADEAEPGGLHSLLSTLSEEIPPEGEKPAEEAGPSLREQVGTGDEKPQKVVTPPAAVEGQAGGVSPFVIEKVHTAVKAYPQTPGNTGSIALGIVMVLLGMVAMAGGASWFYLNASNPARGSGLVSWLTGFGLPIALILVGLALVILLGLSVYRSIDFALSVSELNREGRKAAGVVIRKERNGDLGFWLLCQFVLHPKSGGEEVFQIRQPVDDIAYSRLIEGSPVVVRYLSRNPRIVRVEWEERI